MARTFYITDFQNAAGAGQAAFQREMLKIKAMPVAQAVPYVYNHGLANSLFAQDHTIPWAANVLHADIQYDTFDEVTDAAISMLGTIARRHPDLTNNVLEVYSGILEQKDLPRPMRFKVEEESSWIVHTFMKQHGLSRDPDPDALIVTPI